MTIDKEQLITLLIEKTGLDRDHVEDQLGELVSRIQQAAQQGKSFEVEGFGTFSMEDGELQFEPTEVLETEINNKYAGMKPIEMIGAFKEPGGEEIPDMDNQQDDQDKVWAFDEDAVRPKEPAEEPVMNTSDGEDDLAEENQEEAVEELEPESQEEEQSDEDVQEKLSEVTEANKDEKVTEEPKVTESDEQEPEKVVAEEETDDPIGRFLVAAIVVIALGIGGWFAYDIGLSNENEPSQVSQSRQVQQSSNVPAQQTGNMQEEPTSQKDAAANPQENQSDSEPEQQSQVTTQEGTNDQQPTYGLHGTLNSDVDDGYTIVVHSLRVEQKAENRRQDLQQAGFRALVNQATVNGTTYYRVGIGQFETVKSAQQAIPEIPEEYKDNNFIKRIK